MLSPSSVVGTQIGVAIAQAEIKKSIASVIADALCTEFSISLIKEDAAFVAGIHAYLQDEIEPNIVEAKLREIYVPVNELMQGDPDTVQARCTRALTRLKTQGILLRADFGGLSTDGEYTLSTLGLAISDHMHSERALTKQSLEFMLMRLRAELSQIVAAAQSASEPGEWERAVIFPLRYLVAEMIRMIDKRQRGLDASHAALRSNISILFEQSWLCAIDSCTEMLQSVSSTLGELNAVLTEHAESLDRQMSELGDCTSGHPEMPFLVERVRNQICRIQRWSETRYEAWNGYFGTVNEYIRLVIQIDPENRMRARIRDQIRRFVDRPHGLVIVEQDPFFHLRVVARPVSDQVVAVPSSVYESRGLADYVQPAMDPIDEAIQTLVQRLKESGEIDIVAAVMQEAAGFTDGQWFILMSRATPVLLRHGVSARDILRQHWIRMSPQLEAQTLIVRTTERTNERTTDGTANEALHPKTKTEALE